MTPPTSRSSRGVLARAVRSHTERHLSQMRKGTYYAVVRQVTPLQVELEGHRLILDEDHLVVTQWVRRYGYDYGLAVGDTVLVSHMPNDDFVVQDVVSTAKVENGLDLGSITTSSDPNWAVTGAVATPDRHIVKKVPMLDADGTVLGYVPVYGTLS